MTTKLVSLSSTSLVEAFGAGAVAAEAASPCHGSLRFHHVLSGGHLPASRLLRLYYRVRQVSSYVTGLASAASSASSACRPLAACFTATAVGYTCSERFISGSYDGALTRLEYQSR